jgi:hypothetical protein
MTQGTTEGVLSDNERCALVEARLMDERLRFHTPHVDAEKAVGARLEVTACADLLRLASTHAEVSERYDALACALANAWVVIDEAMHGSRRASALSARRARDAKS